MMSCDYAGGYRISREAADAGVLVPTPATPSIGAAPDTRLNAAHVDCGDGCRGIVQGTKRASENDDRSSRLAPVVTRSAIASPIAAECLKPCPEHGEAIRTRSVSG